MQYTPAQGDQAWQAISSATMPDSQLPNINGYTKPSLTDSDVPADARSATISAIKGTLVSGSNNYAYDVKIPYAQATNVVGPNDTRHQPTTNRVTLNGRLPGKLSMSMLIIKTHRLRMPRNHRPRR